MNNGSDQTSGPGKDKKTGQLFIDPIPVIYPKHSYKIKEEGGQDYILDEIRKKWLLLTPEEWVRQNFIRFLLESKQCPAPYIVIERKITTGERISRFDIVVYGKDAKPWMLVECKNMNVQVNKNHVLQILRYHRAAPAKYLVITNGLFTWCFEKGETGFAPVMFIPGYEQ